MVVLLRVWTCIWVMLLVAALMLNGCLGMKAPPVSRPAAPALFVDYQRSGGIAAGDDRLVIFDNGVMLVSSRTTSREILLNQSELNQIAAIFDTAQFLMVEGNYTSPYGGADFMQYSIRYKNRTVNIEDTAIPPSLVPVISEMDSLLSKGLNSGQGDLPLPVRVS